MKRFITAALITVLAAQTAAFAQSDNDALSADTAGASHSTASISQNRYSGDWVTVSDWAVEYVNAYRDTGLMPLYLYNYEVTDYTVDITREQFCELMEPILNRKGYLVKNEYTASFDDCDNISVVILADIGIISGTSDTTFEPDKNITREEAAVILARLLDYTDTYHYEKTDSFYHYKDEPDFSDWAKEAIYAVYNAKIMNGIGSNRFSPMGAYTIEQAIKVSYDLNNLIDDISAEASMVTDLPNEWLTDGYYALTDKDTIYISASTDKKDCVLTLNAADYGSMDSYTYSGIPYLAANKADDTAEVYNLKTAKLLFTIPHKVEKLAFDYIIVSTKNDAGKERYGVYDYNGNEVEKPELTMQELREKDYMGSSGGSSGSGSAASITE